MSRDNEPKQGKSPDSDTYRNAVIRDAALAPILGSVTPAVALALGRANSGAGVEIG